ncbi:centrosomal protein of 68 kDa isoform X2 [Leuresthes tenuis]|uniref:centrosomal protein of 68 kDa isoform X2 n=1 Tax=Leuresthes tenuis TaxID=355514 RepID=UPI003B5092DC
MAAGRPELICTTERGLNSAKQCLLDSGRETLLPLYKEKQLAVGRREHNMKFLTKPRDVLNPESSQSDISTSSSSPFSVSGLQTQLCSQKPTLQSPCHGSKSTQQSPTSSILQVQRLNPLLRSQLASTVLYPTYTPHSVYSKPGHTQLRLWEREDSNGGVPKLSSPEIDSKEGSASSYQANYWTCAIPKSLRPSPNRHSAGWNPNKEYQALLDYTYPLRPGHVDSLREPKMQGDSLPLTDPNLQDSGIELDQLCNSASVLGFNFSLSRAVQTQETNQERSTINGCYRSSDFQGFTRSSDGLFSGIPLSPTDPIDLSLDSLDHNRDRSGTNQHQSAGCRHQLHTESSSTSFINSTSVLPQTTCVCGEVDEDFRPLPEKLEVMQQLFRQVREVTAKLSQPGRAITGSLDSGTTSSLSSFNLLGKRGAEDDNETVEIKELQEDKQDIYEGNKRGHRSAAGNHKVSETLRSNFGAGLEPSRGGLSQSLREVEALMERLSGSTLSDSQKNNQEDQDNSYTLMQHIQIFCSHLELLIQQLYAVSQRMEQLATPTVDIDSVKSSLAEYQSFQREVSSRQPITSCVLHAGYHLLSCINNTSPFLRDTLLLIERQSVVLQTSTDQFFSSILSAMDSLTQTTHPSPVE